LQLFYHFVIFLSPAEIPENYSEYGEAQELEEHLKAHEGKQLWANEDITLRKTELASTTVCIDTLTQYTFTCSIGDLRN
jgi:hypothetical protein